MFKFNAKLKHSFLRQSLGHDDVEETNRLLDKLMCEELIEHDDCSKESRPSECFRDYKSQIAFGYWGMPQLIAQLLDKDVFVRNQAIRNLSNEIIDPEKCYRAIHHQKLLPPFVLLLKEANNESQTHIKHLLITLDVVAAHLCGAQHMLQVPCLMERLFTMIDKSVFAQEVAQIICKMVGHYTVAEDMVNAEYVPLVLKTLKISKDLYDLYAVLSYLIERNPASAFKYGTFELLCPLITKPTLCQPIILKCFALAIQCEAAQFKCDTAKVIPRLLSILDEYEENEPTPTLDWRPETMTLEYAAMSMHNCLLSTRSRWLCLEYWEMPNILIRHAHCKTNHRLQLHCLQILRHITEKPIIKRYVGSLCKNKIRRIYCPNQLVMQAKMDLLKWIRSRNFHVAEL